MDDLEEIFPLRAQAGSLSALGLGYRLGQSLEAWVFPGASLDFASENHRRGRCSANHGGVGALQGGDFNLLVQSAREHHVRATVITRDHAENDGPLEVHDCPADLSAILELQPPHRFG